MFISKGDNVVCINNRHREDDLTLGKKYKVIDIDIDVDCDVDNNSYIGIRDDCNQFYFYRCDRFDLDISYERRYKLLRLEEVVSSRSRL